MYTDSSLATTTTIIILHTVAHVQGAVTYGSAVALRCGWARERFLGVHSQTGEVGFWRTLIGTAEKWILACPEVIKASRTSGLGLSGQKSSSSSSGGGAMKGVMAGDQIILQSQSTKDVLVVMETADGLEISVCPPESALLSQATFEVPYVGQGKERSTVFSFL